jgi:hypothetical protein
LKRIKTEPDPPSLEDEMEQLVKNALVDVSALVNQLSGEMDVAESTPPEVEKPPSWLQPPPDEPVSFLGNPLKSIRLMSLPTLGNIVSYKYTHRCETTTHKSGKGNPVAPFALAAAIR